MLPRLILCDKIKTKDTRIILFKKEGVGSNIIPKK